MGRQQTLAPPGLSIFVCYFDCQTVALVCEFIFVHYFGANFTSMCRGFAAFTDSYETLSAYK